MEDNCQFKVSNERYLSRSVSTASTQSSSHHSRRNEHTSWQPALSPRHRHTRIHTSHFLLLIFLTCCISLTSARSNVYIEESMVEVEARSDPSELLGSTFARLARSGTIVVDRSPPPVPDSWVAELELAPKNDDLKPRDATSASTPAVKNSTSSTLAPTITSSGIATAETTTVNSPLPTPFDVGFSKNITANCQSFMNTMLSNSSFKACLPFSLLLQNSNSFFQTTKSLVRISQTLDASCSANFASCSTLMTSFSKNITTPSACAADLTSQNPLIQQAQLGLQAYKPLYTASCLRNPSTSAYCFADAITNTTNPTDSYIYFLPLNISLVGGSQPTCDSCLKNTMAVFEAASGDRSSALASTYVAAAMQINVNCGPGFVNQSLAAAITNSGTRSINGAGPSAGLLAIFIILLSWLL